MSRLSVAIVMIDALLLHFGTKQPHNNTLKMTHQISKVFGLSPLGRSALFMAAGRAAESNKHKNERAFYDPYAHLFATSDDCKGNKYLNKMSKYAVAYIKHRTLYIDNHLTNIINKFNNEQIDIVILGVGCDTRSYRMNAIKNNPNITVYELDLMDVIKYRHNILIQQNNAQKQTKAKVVSIAVDFRKNEWMNTLINKGYNKNNNCNIWIAEGLFPFLKKQEINNLLENIHENGSNQNMDTQHHKHWLIGNFLNKNTKLQSKLNKLNKENNNTTCKTGFTRPHLLLNSHKYSHWEIKPIGSLNKNIKTYQQYLDAINSQNNDTSTHLKADHFAKSFMFCASK